MAAPIRRNRLREFRLAAKMTQRQLADAIGVSQAAISIAERMSESLGDEKWEAMAALFGTDVLRLRGWTKIYAEI